MPFREKLLVAWVGLRGSVPIVLATFPLAVGITQAGEIFTVVSFIVVTSVLIQGFSLTTVAPWLNKRARRVKKPCASANSLLM